MLLTLLAALDATATVPAGVYELDHDPSAIEQTIESRIEEVTRSTFFLFRGVTRRVLARATTPCREIEVSRGSEKSTLRCDDQRPATAPLTGNWVEFRGADGRRLSLRLEVDDDALVQTFRSRHGVRENRYSWASDQRHLDVRVTITADVLKEPLVYHLRYEAKPPDETR